MSGSSSSSGAKKKGRKSKGSGYGSKAWLIKEIRKMRGKASKTSTQASLKRNYNSLKKKSGGKRGKGAKGKSASSPRSSKSGKKVVALYKKLQKRLTGKVPSASFINKHSRGSMMREIQKYRDLGVSPRKSKSGSKKRGSKYDLANKIAKKLGLSPSSKKGLHLKNLSDLRNIAEGAGISIGKGKRKSKASSSPSASAKSRRSDLQKLKDSLRKKHPRMKSANLNKLAQKKLKQQAYKGKGYSRTPSDKWIREANKYRRKFGSSPKSMKLADIKKALKKKSLSPKKSSTGSLKGSKSQRNSQRKSLSASKKGKPPVLDNKHNSQGGKHVSPTKKGSPKLVVEDEESSSSESSVEFHSPTPRKSAQKPRKHGQYKKGADGLYELVRSG